MISYKKITILTLLLSCMGVLLLVSFTNAERTIQDEWKAPEGADTVKNPYPITPALVKKGQELYNLYCWSCHGETGYGDGAAGGALGVKPADFHSEKVKKEKEGVLFWKLTNGNNNMPPFKEVLSEEERWQLIAYIQDLGKQK